MAAVACGELQQLIQNGTVTAEVVFYAGPVIDLSFACKRAVYGVNTMTFIAVCHWCHDLKSFTSVTDPIQLWLPHLLFSQIHCFFFRPPLHLQFMMSISATVVEHNMGKMKGTKLICLYIIGFEVLTVVIMKSCNFWDSSVSAISEHLDYKGITIWKDCICEIHVLH
jgi:hypothetical protein